MTPDDALARYLEIANSFDGCGAQHDAARFCSVVCPNGPAPVAAEFCRANAPGDRNSSCKDTAIGLLSMLLRELGQEDLQAGPWRLDLWERVRALARAHQALLVPAPGVVVRPGCIVHLESATGRHWRTIVRDLGGERWESIDGGGKDAQGYQLIHRATCEMRGAAYDVTSGKPVLEIVDVPALLASLLREREPAPTPTSEEPPPGSVAEAVRIAAETTTTPLASQASPAEIVDVSAANGRLDFGAIAAAGVVATIVRASLGRVDTERDVDARMREHANTSRRSIPNLTAYGLVFARHGMRQDADRQARDLLKLWHEIGSTLLPMGDFEREPGDERVTEQEYADAIEMWIDTMTAELGRAPLLYTGPGWWDSSPVRRAMARAGACPLVCSDFERSRPVGSPLLPTPWKASGAAVHQYAGSPTSTGRMGIIAGVGAPIDRSRALIPIDGLRV